VELMDNMTCDYCRHMNGKVFSVQKAKNRISKEISAGPESIGENSPFATSIKLADFTTMDESTLESAGITKPPFHPHCRGRVVSGD
jgi:thioredoxin-related protein